MAVRADGIATRGRILDNGRALFAAGGYEATSLRQIAAAAGVDLATLKYHFGDKARLFGEVYRLGHATFIETLEPLLEGFDSVSSPEHMRELIDDLVVAMHDFVENNYPFVRLTLYRMLEDSADVISVEEELQTVAISRIDRTFKTLLARGIIRDVDTRAFVVFLVSSFSFWHVTARVKPHWLGAPGLDTPGGRARSETFFVDWMETLLV